MIALESHTDWGHGVFAIGSHDYGTQAASPPASSSIELEVLPVT
jgi:hypothetical protein